MAGYGSIELQETITLLGEEPVAPQADTSHTSWESIRKFGTRTAPKIFVASLLLCLTVNILDGRSSSDVRGHGAWYQPSQLANFLWPLGSANDKQLSKNDWKQFIHNDSDPSVELFHEQIVDHNNPQESGTFQQRYFQDLRYWDGPGHPIFMILGGEGPLTHILYPFIEDVLAKRFGGVTFNPEHRYFGVSYPKEDPSIDELRVQMTPRQAMQDFVEFVHAMQEKLGCGPKGTEDYCPVVTVGGSYPVSSITFYLF